MNSPVFCRKLKAWRARSVALASSDRLDGFVGESGIACGAAPSLRTIFPVKNISGYCGYSGSDNADRLGMRRSASYRTRALIFLKTRRFAERAPARLSERRKPFEISGIRHFPAHGALSVHGKKSGMSWRKSLPECGVITSSWSRNWTRQ
jgi:hypothetical protein